MNRAEIRRRLDEPLDVKAFRLAYEKRRDEFAKFHEVLIREAIRLAEKASKK